MTEPTDLPARSSDADYCSRWPGDTHSWVYHHDGRARLWYRTCGSCNYIDLTAVSQEIVAHRAVTEAFTDLSDTFAALLPTLQAVGIQFAKVMGQISRGTENALQARNATGECSHPTVLNDGCTTCGARVPEVGAP